jgi:dihydroneopterin aldolase
MAEAVATAVLGFDARIEGVRVTVRKLRPPIPVDVATAAVTITRMRER